MGVAAGLDVSLAAAAGAVVLALIRRQNLTVVRLD